MTRAPWPPRPPGLSVAVGNAARFKRWGRFRWETSGDHGEIRILNGWAAQHIERVTIPQLAALGRPTKTRCHREVAESLRALWAEWEAEGLLKLVRTWNGCYVPRRTRGKDTLSAHSWGIAFDINAAWNPIGSPSPPVGAPGSTRRLAIVARAFGWFWGGWFRNRPDPMHFEALP